MADGTDQRQRRPRAFEPGYFRVDELRFEDRVGISAQLASTLAFIDERGGARGNWSGLFAGDEILLLAHLLSQLAVAERQRADADAAEPAQLARELCAMALRLDRWLRALSRLPADPAQRIAQEIERHVRSQLAEDLRWVVDRFGPSGLPERLLPIWGTRAGVSPRRSGDAAPAADRPGLQARCAAFRAAADAVGRLARDQLALARAGSQRHEPAAGLLAAFLRLYETVQARINQFTEHHIDFYYRDCLGLRCRPAVADRAHLACERDARVAADVRIAAGTAFDAGKGADGRRIEFLAEDALTVTDAQVTSLCTLLLQRDPLISPERELAHVTRMQAHCLPEAAASFGRALPSWPLFGGHDADDARIGLAVGSPVLWLAEGEREIRVGLRLETIDGAAMEGLLQALEQASKLEFFERFGRLFSHWLLAPDDLLDAAALQRLRTAALGVKELLPGRSAGPGDPLSLLLRADGTDEGPDRQLIFHQVLQGAFGIALSTAQGWLTAHEVHVSRPAGGTRDTLCLTVNLRPHHPAIVGCVAAVHGAQWDTTTPLMRIELVRHARLFTYSLLEEPMLSAVRIEVQARGVRNLALSNQLGRLDATKPFHPFGPLPDLGAYLVIGSPEAARKQVEAMTLHVEWAGLPRGDLGFEAHYAGYEQPLDNDDARVALGVLRDGQWHAPAAGLRDPRLFSTATAHRLSPRRDLVVDPAALRGFFRPERSVQHDEDFRFDHRTRNGFVRLQLCAPEGAFGHRRYAQQLTEAVSANARRKHPLPLPQAPYTPEVERLTLDYAAASTVRPNAAHEGGDRLYHLHPFGIEVLAAPGFALWPRYPRGGALFIGLRAAVAPEGRVSLLFHLQEGSAGESSGPRPRLRWTWLAGNQWHGLPDECQLSDTTSGFLGSGIVVLDLPPGLRDDNTVMPSGLYWLCVHAEDGLDGLAALHAVRAQALCVARVLSADAATAPPAGPITQPVGAVPGLALVQQVGSAFGLQAAESEAQMRVRCGERLRHRNRAVLGWDVERLVLEHFAGVAKVKCFANLRSDDAAPAPGHVLVAVLPAAPAAWLLQPPKLDAGELEAIRALLQARASPFAGFEVRNAAYEPVQVRCSVRFKPGEHVGTALRRLEAAIVDYLSPWQAEQRRPSFGWSLRCDDVAAHLRSLDFIDRVGGLSLLHVSEDWSHRHVLIDTARGPASQRDRPLRPSVPWGIAYPMARHLIELDSQTRPRPTGIARLAIGSTFIMGEARDAWA